jgi:hypothetical protein
VDFLYWELFTELTPGHFYTRDMNKARSILHAQHICPLVVKDGVNKIKMLIYNDCFIHLLPREAECCVNFLQIMKKIRPHNIQYRGETFAGFCAMVFESLCTIDPRIPPSLLEKQFVLAKTKRKFEQCGDPCEEGQIDHHVPRSNFGKDTLGNYKYLCISCHKIKTTEDISKINIEDSNPYRSRFDEHSWKYFVQSRKPAQIVAVFHEKTDAPIWECDIRSCRYNAITENNNQPVPFFHRWTK